MGLEGGGRGSSTGDGASGTGGRGGSPAAGSCSGKRTELLRLS